ncbi:NADP-dependent oxidoreductase [Aurantiacibacter spongiae]|uniref:NADP-dependent oxidoreductase n=1 Tax=Aurantiacibacter spongiae TaxID=2488860 RepID=A0A3N5CW63_9SPHN|nr:NADP-dependent oxidoreductase [Aurantiacibacter spongiae]RPF72566.1 NADP-dependent oxidoreductase [Aurantiacibacter spongiae]
MKAWTLTRYGGPDASAMREVKRPAPGPSEVLVRVKAAGLNPVDFKIRNGDLKPVLRFDLPVTMGNELAGIVEECGTAVSRFARGDRVFARTGKMAMGAFAEYAAVHQDYLAKIPGTLDFRQAAAIPLAGLTALQALRDELKIGPGSRVFISAGAGGVGTFAVRIAKWLGAQVATTASPRGHDLVKDLGADTVIDYTSDDFEDVLSDMDGAFDLIGGETLSRTFGIVKKGGRVVSIAGTPEPRTARQDIGAGKGMAALFWVASAKLRWQAWRHGVDYRFLLMHPSGAELHELALLAADGTLEPVIDRTFPFDEIADAMAYLEKGHAKGKVVVEMTD